MRFRLGLFIIIFFFTNLIIVVRSGSPTFPNMARHETGVFWDIIG
jgi:hypothetical protein